MISGTSNLICAWMLALLLVLFQTATLAHSHDELAEADDLCEVCVHAQQSDDAVPTDHRFVHAVLSQAVSPYLYSYRAVADVPAAHTPRAPPLIP